MAGEDLLTAVELYQSLQGIQILLAGLVEDQRAVQLQVGIVRLVRLIELGALLVGVELVITAAAGPEGEKAALGKSKAAALLQRRAGGIGDLQPGQPIGGEELREGAVLHVELHIVEEVVIQDPGALSVLVLDLHDDGDELQRLRVKDVGPDDGAVLLLQAC